MKTRKAPKLIAAKARSMLRHYTDTVLPNRFKAQVVATSRVAAVRDREALLAARDEPGDVRHVYEKQGAHRLRDLGHARKIDDARIGAGAGHDHFRLVFVGKFPHLLVVDQAGGGIDAVLHGVKELAGKVHLGAVREMPAVRQTHAQNGVAGFE